MKNTYIIAELGNTHEGSPGLAGEMMRVAAECGADAVKFQTHIFDAESLPNAPNPPYFKHESRKEYFERTAFSEAQWLALKQMAVETYQVDFLSSPFSIEAVDLLERVDIPLYKIPSGEVSNTPFLKRVAQTGKRALLSSGMSSWDELDRAVSVLEKNGCSDLLLMQCTSEYPCPPEHSGLNVLDELKTRYGRPVGYSDHTLSIAIPVAAVVMGAEVIEKHFTLSRDMYGSDARNSFEPDDFKRLVDEIRAVDAALASDVTKGDAQDRYAEMKHTFEKSIVAACDVAEGTVLEDVHLAYKKPGGGIPAAEYEMLLGCRLNTSVTRNHVFTRDELDNA